MAGLLPCIMGPTAAGKTDFAIALATASSGELISVDSALVYRGLEIGAAKPNFPHHVMSIRDPSEVYTAADFAEDAAQAIADIRQRGKLPILVGGTMLYFRALLQGFDDIPATPAYLRQEVEQEAGQRGWPALHADLAAVDPVTAARLHPNHSQRIGRAIEVWRLTGKPLSEWQSGNHQPEVAEQTLPIVICPRDRQVLHRRIEQRFDHMLAEGLVDEVANLRARADLHLDLPAMRAVGYRQIWRYLEGFDSLEEARLKGIAATRQLAKRQLTWLRRWPDALWCSTAEDGSLLTCQAEIGSTSQLHAAVAGVFSAAGGERQALADNTQLINGLTRVFKHYQLQSAT